MTRQRWPRARRAIARHLGDALLLAALLLVLALSLEDRQAPARSLGEAARTAVERQVGAAPPASGNAGAHASRDTAAPG